MPSGKATLIDDAARALLERETTLVLATVSDDGHAIATPLFYYFDGEMRIYWLSSAESRHSRNLTARPGVAVAVFKPVSDWREIGGVQMEGIAGPVNDADLRATILARYRERFGLGAELDGAIGRSALYVFHARWCRWVDSLASHP